MEKFYRKNKKWLIPVAIVLVTAIIVGILAATTNMIGKISNSNIGGFRELNEDNLLNVEMYEDLEKEYDGVDVDVDKDGVITLDGKAKSNQTIELGTFNMKHPDFDTVDPTGLSLKVEFYLKGAIDGASDTYYLILEDASGVVQAVNLNSNTPGVAIATIGAPECDFIVSLVIKKGADLNNVKIYPGVYTEADASFYGK